MPHAPRLAAAVLALFVATSAMAALPPHHQRAAELRAVLGNAAGAFGGTPIDRIEYVRADLYRVTAGRCHADAAIVDLPTPRGVVGGRRFEVRMGRAVCGR